MRAPFHPGKTSVAYLALSFLPFANPKRRSFGMQTTPMRFPRMMSVSSIEICDVMPNGMQLSLRINGDDGQPRKYSYNWNNKRVWKINASHYRQLEGTPSTWQQIYLVFFRSSLALDSSAIYLQFRVLQDEKILSCNQRNASRYSRALFTDWLGGWSRLQMSNLKSDTCSLVDFGRGRSILTILTFCFKWQSVWSISTSFWLWFYVSLKFSKSQGKIRFR